MKLNRKLFSISIVMQLLLLFAVQGAMATTEDYRFHWSPSPIIDGDGVSLASAVLYEVWIQRDDAPAEFLARVERDTVYILTAEPDVAQRIRVIGVSMDGAKSYPSEWSEEIFFTSVRGEGVPVAATIGNNYPNPFNPETNLIYGIPADVKDGQAVRLEIYTVDGRRVKSFEVDRSPGWHEVVWDGTDDRGNPSATGVYLSRLLVGTAIETKKLTMLK